MSDPGLWTSVFFSGSLPSHALRKRASRNYLLASATSIALFCVAGPAWSGPCTAQIAQLEQQIKLATVDPTAEPEVGPTAPQTVGAQLHHQPTPGSVRHAEHVANADADAALDRARKADAAGNADACHKAVGEASRLYGIE
jgi:hypothetical protein